MPLSHRIYPCIQPIGRWVSLVFFLLILPSLALAQQAAAPGASPGPRALIEGGRLELQQIEAALQRDNLDDKRLMDLRARFEPLHSMLAEIIGREQPRADEIKARIEQLGPMPDAAKGQTEGADVARDRAEQQRQWKEADDTLRLARALGLRIEQIGQSIADRRRANFARQILTPQASILSPLLWLDVVTNLPSDIKALRFLAGNWAEAIINNTSWFEALVLVLLAIGGFFFLPHARRWVRTGSLARNVAVQDDFVPSALVKAMQAFRMSVLSALLPSLVLVLLFGTLQGFGLLPGRVEAIVEMALTALGFVLFMSGISRAVLAPDRPAWRLIAMRDSVALELWRMVRLVTVTNALSRILEAVYSAIVASLPLTIATKGVLCVLVGLFMARGLRRAFGQKAQESEQDTGEGAGREVSLLPLRLVGWSFVVVILLAALFGYAALASFVSNQAIWLITLVFVGVILLLLVEEGIGSGLSGHGLFGRKVRETTGLSASSLDQFSVLGAGFLRLILLVAIGMMVLAPWGLDSVSFLGSLRAAFFGFQVGGVTISLSTIVIAIILFTVGFLATRSIQNWLDTRYLPHTGLDLGLRNSIRTIFGYIGILLAAVVALGQLGLSLDKLTIVAGALSVGIGFGLQSIVNNFVSGLILLWERPIRVGDWIVVGDEQGIVKRINVRATEILTFDRASLIIPNSEFISGRVKNWVHADRTARIIIPVNVEYSAEPEQVQSILRDAALNHREVMSDPAPIVIFKNLGESGLDFELRCFCDVDAMSTTRSELMFDIFARLKAAGIAIPFPTRRVEITNVPAGSDNAAAMLVAEIQKGKL